MTDVPFEAVDSDDIAELPGKKLSWEELLPLARVRKVNPEGYAYLVKADQLLTGKQNLR